MNPSSHGRHEHGDIRLGTLVPGGPTTPRYIEAIAPHGFESFQITFGTHVGELDLERLAGEVREVLARAAPRAVVSAVGVYGNPLVETAVAADWARLIDVAGRFGTDLVCGFAGRIPNQPIPASLGRFAEVFGPLAQRAEERGVRLAFENCNMDGTWEYGDWNIAHAPAAWEQMFECVPSPALGLEWEPCHQLVSLIDPLPQLRAWLPRVFHIHGKDATVLWDVVRSRGLRGGEPYVLHRTPGFGDTNWTDLVSVLRMGGWRGSIDIEGWHDPVYRDDLEMTGQVRALEYLRTCRGGRYVPNPEVS